MRGVRWLLLLAITGILAAVGISYYLHKDRQAREAPPPPPNLPANVTATSDVWTHTVYDGETPVVEIRAAKMRQIREPSAFDLEGVELLIFKPGGYDRVRSGHAQFDIAAGDLYSEGDVEITLNVPEDGTVPEFGLLAIRSSGVHFNTESGRATTERPTEFQFRRGEGSSLGATYDPNWSEVTMHSEVRLRWYGNSPDAEAMKVEAGFLKYKEDQSRIYLSPWSRFTRGNLSIDAADSVVWLQDGTIHQVDAQRAHGTDRHPKRQIDFDAGHMVLLFDPNTLIEKIVGEQSAHLSSTTAAARTDVASGKLFLEFRPAPAANESILDHALAVDDAKVESHPRPGAAPQPVRILRSQTIKAIMRPGGEEIQRLETPAPGAIEFVPTASGQQHRRIRGDRLTIDYLPGNRIDMFRATKARTWTEGRTGDGAAEPPLETSSNDLLARFDPATGDAVRIEQRGEFRYRQGERQATAATAVFEVDKDLIALSRDARIWDSQGSTSASEIVLDQHAKVSTAKGNVSSTRLPDPDAPPGGLLAPNEEMHATAERMAATADGSYVAYEGDAVLWQGPDRLTADRIEINREHRTLAAKGNVVSQLASRDGEADSPAVYTVVNAGNMMYMDEHRSAHYQGDVHLRRPGLDVTSDELRAFFSKAGEDQGTGLHHAVADGGVRITQTDAGRRRLFTAQHAEYYAGEEKTVLSGGQPRVVDSVRGTTEGRQLIYFARDDRLLVDGADSRPAVSRLKKNGSQ